MARPPSNTHRTWSLCQACTHTKGLHTTASLTESGAHYDEWGTSLCAISISSGLAKLLSGNNRLNRTTKKKKKHIQQQ